ncbi:MAG: PIN domain-containing protein, partial [Nitrososphaerales archaeon]
NKGHQIFISNITIFELSAKGAKYAALGKIPPERVIRGVKALAYSETINTIEAYESTILLIAFKLRSILSDFIDCLILSSAINQCDALITEDKDIQNIKGDEKYQEIVTKRNSKYIN